MIKFLQLSFYDLLAFDTTIPTINALTKITYSSGYNVKFNGLEEFAVSQQYLSLGLSSNIIENVNVMLMPIIACFPVSGILYLLHRHSNSYIFAPRFKLYSANCLLQWVFIFFSFNLYNICVSLIIQFSTQNNKVCYLLYLAPYLSSLFLD